MLSFSFAFETKLVVWNECLLEDFAAAHACIQVIWCNQLCSFLLLSFITGKCHLYFLHLFSGLVPANL